MPDFIYLSATGVAEMAKSTNLKGCPHTFVYKYTYINKYKYFCMYLAMELRYIFTILKRISCNSMHFATANAVLFLLKHNN